MKRIKVIAILLAFTVTAVLAVVEPVFATEPACVYSQQYYKMGMNYLPTGQLGLHYTCIINPNFCTYWEPVPMSGDFYPCRQGTYWQIIL